jgi:hypothetical protein
MTDVTQDMDQDTVELWAANESSFRGELTKRAREGGLKPGQAFGQ